MYKNTIIELSSMSLNKIYLAVYKWWHITFTSHLSHFQTITAECNYKTAYKITSINWKKKKLKRSRS